MAQAECSLTQVKAEGRGSSVEPREEQCGAERRPSRGGVLGSTAGGDPLVKVEQVTE